MTTWILNLTVSFKQLLALEVFWNMIWFVQFCFGLIYVNLKCILFASLKNFWYYLFEINEFGRKSINVNKNGIFDTTHINFIEHTYLNLVETNAILENLDYFQILTHSSQQKILNWIMTQTIWYICAAYENTIYHLQNLNIHFKTVFVLGQHCNLQTQYPILVYSFISINQKMSLHSLLPESSCF